jgi:hypothetical protein
MLSHWNQAVPTRVTCVEPRHSTQRGGELVVSPRTGSTLQWNRLRRTRSLFGSCDRAKNRRALRDHPRDRGEFKKTDEGWGKQLVPIHLPLLNTSRALRTHSTAYISLSTPPADPREDPPRLARRSFPTPCPPAQLSSSPPSPTHLQAHTTPPPLLDMPFTTNGTNGAGPAPAVVLEEPASVVDHSRVQHYIGESLIPPGWAEPGAGGGMEVVQQGWSCSARSDED